MDCGRSQMRISEVLEEDFHPTQVEGWGFIDPRCPLEIRQG